jgi:transketolase
MGSVVNGLTLSGLRGYGATFLTFLDYMRPPVRLSAMMSLPSIWVYTHDSIGVGEDGPTHQPIEHLAILRATPGIDMFRPGDANEVSEAWRHAVESRRRPTVIALTRQSMPTLDRSKYASAAGVRRGGYLLADCPDIPDLLLIATGSELHLAVDAHERLRAAGVKTRVISLPCWSLFDRQPESYRNEVLPPSMTARLAIEAGSALGWERYTGLRGATVTIDRFGASAPIKDLMKYFGFTVDSIVTKAMELIDQA